MVSPFRITLMALPLLTTFALGSDAPKPAAPGRTEAKKQSIPAKPSAKEESIHLLKGLSHFELQRTMNYMRASLGTSCDYCHVVSDEGQWDWASDAKEEKLTAREMIAMTMDINKKFFEGSSTIGCFSCHHGATHPSSITLPQMLPPKLVEEQRPDRSKMPTAEALITAYMKATSTPAGARKLHGVRIDSKGDSTPIDVVQSGDNVIVTSTGPRGEMVQFSDGTTGWMKNPGGSKAMEPDDLARFRESTSSLALPILDPKVNDFRVRREEKIGDTSAWLVERRWKDGTVERYWFDSTSGLLLRAGRIKPTQVGRIPEQVEYSDYRDVAGAKVPFDIRTELVDPRSSAERKFETIEYGVTVDSKQFEMPAGPAPK